ncbi:type I-E CRISPR-associated protein Cas6/Cse3/CasE [Glutamicibacter sp. PS]|uniref:type I-E CRISPR-associated protein Cas6/Cse3/CasE n=1 Tax=Glutamicibacter sp. PS TaxID=3075634 RepID=UPI0028402997|nr:type I-E CRISPR-associated protein Cas6/Cse3/CasE [Glutamicibacter sp. PS]MDR4534009.1 type I-E CRISPR-associated protein Cas6/Cse3/CasE [Glutamicibacter sp. PS]
MTWFSTIDLNPQRRQARRMLSSGQVMHASVLNAFAPGTELEGPNGRVLWRLDADSVERRLYIVSPERPDLSALAEQAGWETSPGRSADYGALLDTLKIGQQWNFRFRGNPVKSIRQEGRGKVVPHVTPSQQLNWLNSRGADNGFRVPQTEDDDWLATVTSRQDAAFQRADPNAGRPGRVTLRQAQFDGVLEVTDVARLRKALTHGIGRGKAYGCGLMTLRRK